MLHSFLIPLAVIAAPAPFYQTTFDGEQLGTLPLVQIDRPLPGRSADGTTANADEPRWGPQRACCDMPDWTHAWSEDGAFSLVIGGLRLDEQTPVLAAVNNMTFRFSIFEGDLQSGPVKVFDMQRMDSGEEEMDLLANTPIRRVDKSYRPRSGCVLPGCILLHCNRSRFAEVDGVMDWISEGVSVIAVFDTPDGWICQHIYDGPTIGGTNQWDGWMHGYSSSMANYYPVHRGDPLTEAFIPFVDYMNHIPGPAGAGQCFLMKAVRDEAGRVPWRFEGPVLLHEFNETPPYHAHAAAWTPNGVLLAIGDGANSDVRLLTCDDWSDWTNLDRWTTHTRMHGGPIDPGNTFELTANQFWSACPGPDSQTVLVGGDNVSAPIMSVSVPDDPSGGVRFDAIWGRQLGDPPDGGNTQTTCSHLVADRPEAGGPVLARVYLERMQSSVNDVRLLLLRDWKTCATVARMPDVASRVSTATMMGNSIVVGLLQAIRDKGLWSMPLPPPATGGRGLLIEPAGVDRLRMDPAAEIVVNAGDGTEVTSILRGDAHELAKLAAAAPGVGEVWRLRREEPSSPTVATIELPLDVSGCTGEPLHVRAWVCNLAPGMLRMEERLEVGAFSSRRKIALATQGNWRPATIMSSVGDLPEGFCPQFRLLTSPTNGEYSPIDCLLTFDGAFVDSFGQWTPETADADAAPPAERVSQQLPLLGDSWTVSVDLVLPETGLDRGLGKHLNKWPVFVLRLKGGDALQVYAMPQSERMLVDLVRNGEVVETVLQRDQRLQRLDTLHIDVTGGPDRLGLRSRCGGDSTVDIDWPRGVSVELSGPPTSIQWGDMNGDVFTPVEVFRVTCRGDTLDLDMGLDVESGLLLPPCPGDMTGDDVVDVNDLLILAGAWGPCEDDPCVADVTGDGVVGTEDLLYILASWGPCVDE